MIKTVLYGVLIGVVTSTVIILVAPFVSHFVTWLGTIVLAYHAWVEQLFM